MLLVVGIPFFIMLMAAVYGVIATDFTTDPYEK
jgi:hypothetical protein